MTTPVLSFEHVSKSFAGIKALHDVSISIEEGAILGLVGENGAGKTTLMNVLGGVLQPDEGSLHLFGESYAPTDPAEAIDHGVGFIHQELNLFANLSIAENMYVERFPRYRMLPIVNWKKLIDNAREPLRSVGLEVHPSTLVETLPPGERQLVEIAKAIAANARVMIFDEPTTSLTAKETSRLFELIRRLRENGTAIIYISHILNDVLELADAIAVLRDGELIKSGPAGEFTIQTMIAAMVGREIDNLFPDHIEHTERTPALTVRGLGRAGIARDISFTVHKREILGVFGLMGAGRTEVARMIFGVDPFDEGEVSAGETQLPSGDITARLKSGVAFVTEDRREEGLLMDVSIAENLALVSLPDLCRTPARIVDDRRLVELAANEQKRLQIKSGDIQVATAKSLSGGNQQKVVIGKWLANTPEILILDEPTRGIDVGAKYEVYTILNQLAAGGTAILTISSELDELMGICDRILVMSRGEVTGLFDRSQFDQHMILERAFGEGIHSDTGVRA